MADQGGRTNPKKKMPFLVFFKDLRLVFKMDALGLEIIHIALPAAMALAADPIASLIDTAFIGHIGPVEIAAVGVSIAIFNQFSRITIFPLVSITTSFVAEEETAAKMALQDSTEQTNNQLEKGLAGGSGISKDQNKPADSEETNNTLEKALASKDENKPADSEETNNQVEKGLAGSGISKDQNKCIPEHENLDKGSAIKLEADAKNDGEKTADKFQSAKAKKGNKRRHIPSASTAIVIGMFLGLFQAIVLALGAKLLLGFMGVKSDSPMLKPANKYLVLRSLGSPAVLLSLAMQGVFRGFKDTKTPLYATVAADLSNVILDPILIFVCRLGVGGAAIAHVLSQYLMTFILLWMLMKKVDLMPPSIKQLQFKKFLKNGSLLLARVAAVTFCVTLGASLAARLGSTPMAAFQICLQVWMTSSLLADGLAVAGQAILATAFAEKDYEKATAAASRVLQMGFVLGLGLVVVVGLGLQFGGRVFTKDVDVLKLIAIGIPFVAATQPINSLAFVLDGVNFGASDFAFTAYSMVLVAGATIASLFLLSKSNGFVGIWIALTIYMVLRAIAGLWRMGTGTGPWRYLRKGVIL